MWRRGVRRWRTGGILLRGGSCCRGNSAGSIAGVQVMPAVPDARAEEHSDNCTKAAGSQLRSVHGRWLAVRLQAAMLRCGNPITKAYEHNRSHQPHRRSSCPVWNCPRSRPPLSSPRSNLRSRQSRSWSRRLNPGGIFPPSQPRFSPCPVQPGGVPPLCQPSLPPGLLGCRAEPAPLR